MAPSSHWMRHTCTACQSERVSWLKTIPVTKAAITQAMPRRVAATRPALRGRPRMPTRSGGEIWLDAPQCGQKDVRVSVRRPAPHRGQALAMGVAGTDRWTAETTSRSNSCWSGTSKLHARCARRFHRGALAEGGEKRRSKDIFSHPFRPEARRPPRPGGCAPNTARPISWPSSGSIFASLALREGSRAATPGGGPPRLAHLNWPVGWGNRHAAESGLRARYFASQSSS